MRGMILLRNAPRAGIEMHMNQLATQSMLLVALAVLPACFEDGLAELGEYNVVPKGGSPEAAPPLTLGDASVIIPITDPTPAPGCYRFVAHAAGSTGAYAVAGSGSENVRFTFQAPWQGTAYIRSIKPLIDNRVVLHHWLLYADTSARAANVDAVPQTSLDGTLVYGWTPGSTPLELGSDMGIEAAGDVSYSLAVRYTNEAGPATSDSSGVEVCVSSQPVLFKVSLALSEGAL